MKKDSILIIGVGSPFGADRVGWQALALLERQGLAAEFPQLDIRFEQCDRPGSRLLTLLAAAGGTLIIDAMCSGAPAGTVRLFAADELAGETGLLSSHGFGVVDALALGRALGRATGAGLPEALLILGIEMDETVAPEVAEQGWARELLVVTRGVLGTWAVTSEK